MRNERVLPLEQGINFRELGGYKTKDGRMVKYHKLLRSGNLWQLSRKDVRYLKNYGVRIILDLRSELEMELFPDAYSKVTKYYRLSLMPFANTSLQNLRILRRNHINLKRCKGSLAAMYAQLLVDPHAKKSFSNMFKHLLLADEDEGVVVHCTSGKDRTAVATFLILSALGVARTDIKKDYLLTNVIYENLTAHQINNLIKEDGDLLKNKMRSRLVVKTQYFDLVEDICCKISGSVKDYIIEELKITPEEIAQLQEMYLTEAVD